MQPRAAVRLARALWIAWAVIAWNVVFDRVIAVAGRNYLHAAGIAAAGGGPGAASVVPMDAWMRPAVSSGAWIASAAAGVILVIGLLAIHFGSRTIAKGASS